MSRVSGMQRVFNMIRGKGNFANKQARVTIFIDDADLQRERKKESERDENCINKNHKVKVKTPYTSENKLLRMQHRKGERLIIMEGQKIGAKPQ